MEIKDDHWQKWKKDNTWQKYCGFLDLSLPEFMDIQRRLLMEQMELVHDSKIARKFMPQKPADTEEYRKSVPLTTYADYGDYLETKDDSALSNKPKYWVCTSGRSGKFKWIPWTERAADAYADHAIALAVMACASAKYEVNIKKGMRALANLPPPPYGAGYLSEIMVEKMGVILMPPRNSDDEDFTERTKLGFAMGLRYGVQLLSSLSSVLLKMGETFVEGSGKMTFSMKMLHPSIMRRMLVGMVRSKIQKRKLLPRDLWPLKGLIAYGMDTGFFRDQLEYYWGKQPLETYGTMESGNIATQSWTKKNMTFFPAASFFEFIPEEHVLGSLGKVERNLPTVLMDELEPGKCYEVVISNFYGMPFMRYRMGDLIKVVAMEDEETGIRLPQIVFQSRVDGIIDIAGFTRLDEKSIWQALIDSKIKFSEWTARKEYSEEKPVLHVYLEMKEPADPEHLARLLHEKLQGVDQFYRDIDKMLDLRPVRVTVLKPGSFQRYYEEKHKAGADLAHLKPPPINASNEVIKTLLSVGENKES